MPQEYKPLSVSDLIKLAAPQTWSATIIPFMVSIAACLYYTKNIPLIEALLLLVALVLMQSAVNVFNDYADFKKGADTHDNQLDPDDAILVYKNPNPRHVLIFGCICLVIALAIGAYFVCTVGIAPLVCAAIGALVICAYSFGPKSISYLPLGELVSGSVMGVLMPFAVLICLTQKIHLIYVLYCIPLGINVALIMLTNNTCDIEKDTKAGRRTLPCLLGRVNAKKLYCALYLISLTCIVLISLSLSFANALVCIALVLLQLPYHQLIRRCPFNLQARAAAMGQTVNLGVLLGLTYALSYVVAAVFRW